MSLRVMLRRAFSSQAIADGIIWGLAHYTAFAVLWLGLLGMSLTAIHVLVEKQAWMLMVPRRKESWPSIFTAWMLHNDRVHLLDNVKLTALLMSAVTCLLWPRAHAMREQSTAAFLRWKPAIGRWAAVRLFTVLGISLILTGILTQSISWSFQRPSFLDINGIKIHPLHLGFSGVACAITGILCSFGCCLTTRATWADWRIWPTLILGATSFAAMIFEDVILLGSRVIAEPNGSYVNHEGHVIGFGIGLTVGLIITHLRPIRVHLLPGVKVE